MHRIHNICRIGSQKLKTHHQTREGPSLPVRGLVRQCGLMTDASTVCTMMPMGTCMFSAKAQQHSFLWTHFCINTQCRTLSLCKSRPCLVLSSAKLLSSPKISFQASSSGVLQPSMRDCTSQCILAQVLVCMHTYTYTHKCIHICPHTYAHIYSYMYSYI